MTELYAINDTDNQFPHNEFLCTQELTPKFLKKTSNTTRLNTHFKMQFHWWGEGGKRLLLHPCTKTV